MSTLHRTITQYKKIDDITLSHVRQMHLVQQQVRPDVSLDDFIAQVSTQSGVVLVRRLADRLIVGFSTVRLTTQGRCRVLAQGPLVIHEGFRHLHGQVRVLQKLTWIERLRHPFTPLRVVSAAGLCSPALTAAQAAARATVNRAQRRQAVRTSSA